MIYLDYIRVLAVFLVIYGHLITVPTYATVIDGVISKAAIMPLIPRETHNLSFIDEKLANFGTATAVIGVILFFLLSGFLAANTRNKYKSKIDFILHRFKRIYPGWIIALLISSIIAYTQGYKYDLQCYFLNVSLLQTLFGNPAIIGAVWTLVVELYFNLIICFMPTITNKRILVTETIIFILVLLFILFQPTYHFVYSSNLIYSIRFIPLIFVGSSLYIAIYYSSKQNYYYFMLSMLIAYLTLYTSINFVYTFDVFYRGIYSYIIAIGVFIIVYKLKGILKDYKWIKTICKISYMIFCIQLNIGITTIYYLREFNFNSYQAVAGGIIATIFVSLILHYGIEAKLTKNR